MPTKFGNLVRTFLPPFHNHARGDSFPYFAKISYIHGKPYPIFTSRFDEATIIAKLNEDFQIANSRRSVRMFSSDPVPAEIIQKAILIAGTAPSGAHRQPWHFVAISNPETKQLIREKVEEEERTFYDKRAPQEWLDALVPIGTDWQKPHITEAPWVIVVFRRDYDLAPDGSKMKNYYMTESVGIALGMLISALTRVGLATLTHTPAPMTILREICGRPHNEKPYVLLPVGYPSGNCTVPNFGRKPLEEIMEIVN